MEHNIVTEMPGGTKQNGRPSGRPLRQNEQRLLGCGSSHVNAGQFEGLTLYRALYGPMMTGMGCYLILRVDNLAFLVGVVHEHDLGALLLYTFRGALACRPVPVIDPPMTF